MARRQAGRLAKSEVSRDEVLEMMAGGKELEQLESELDRLSDTARA